MITTIHLYRGLFTNGPDMVGNLVSASSTCVYSTMVGGIFSILSADYLTLFFGLPSIYGNYRVITLFSPWQW